MSKDMKNLPEISSFSKEQLEKVLDMAMDLKKNPDKYADALKQKTLVMWFEKPSLRTRLSFETGMTQLGGHAIYLDTGTTHKGKADLKDEIKCLSRFADILMARVYEHRTIEDMVEAADVPVINGLSDLYHPCQAVADVMTVYEFAGKDAVVAYVGDGNNVCNSLINACKILGIKINVATPENMKPQTEPDFWTADPKEAVADADVVYTDIWVSMGESDNKDTKNLEKYQVNEELLGDRYFMHCLPAVRGKEVTDVVMDSKKSLVFDQAENRMHAQKAIMLELLT
ncbi:MAG TPA: ornithine carbamoyltransferase [Candidatus Saccharimonadales bacterium]|nr:ornithine carbamoyltransferase [Candidatus Saccharimonadales bacterium]